MDQRSIFSHESDCYCSTCADNRERDYQRLTIETHYDEHQEPIGSEFKVDGTTVGWASRYYSPKYDYSDASLAKREAFEPQALGTRNATCVNCGTRFNASLQHMCKASENPDTNVNPDDVWKTGRPENPQHYANLDPQPWDVIIAWKMGYLEGSILKYLSRWRNKNGVEDLKKARRFLDKLIEEESK